MRTYRVLCFKGPHKHFYSPLIFSVILRKTIMAVIGRSLHVRLIINPRRACAARITVVVLYMYVCVSVCLSTHAILAVRAIKSIMKDTIVLSIGFAVI